MLAALHTPGPIVWCEARAKAAVADLHPAQSEAQHDPAPAGKLDLYIAAAGFHPRRILPCVIDVGTDNEQLRADPVYMGLNQPRIKGPEYVEVCSSLQQLFLPSPEADDVSCCSGESSLAGWHAKSSAAAAWKRLSSR